MGTNNISGAVGTLAHHQLTEILVAGKQHPPRAPSQRQHGLIVAAGVPGPDLRHVMTRSAQDFDDAGVEFLVGEEPHAAVAGSPKMISSRRR